MTKKLALIAWILGVIAICSFLPFGRDNLMVAMSSILLVPELIKEDYTQNKLNETFKLIVVCFVLSTAASIFSFNLYIGTILTLIISFCIYYFYTYEDRESQSMIFMIYYILILSIPMKNLSQLPMRMLCTIYGAILAMVLYFIIYRTNRTKLANKRVEKAINDLKLFKDEKNKISLNEVIRSLECAEDDLIKNMEKDFKNKNNLLKEEITIELIKNIVYLLEEESVENIIEYSEILDKINSLYNNRIEFKEFEKEILKFEKNNCENEILNKIVRNFIVIYQKLPQESLYVVNKNSFKQIVKEYSTNFNLNYKLHFSMESIKMNLAIKGSILTTIAVFIVFYFNIPNGRWILYTITVTYLPFSDLGVKKLSDRIWGTAIGFILSILIFTVSHNAFFIIVCILISLYFSIYYIPYNKRAIFITFTAIASDYFIVPTESYITICIYRLIFVILAATITYVVLKFIWPVNVKKSVAILKVNYEDLNKLISDNKNINQKEIYKILVINKLLKRRREFLSKYTDTKEILEISQKVKGKYKYFNYII
ncbi:MAG: FUSC family protein [Sarcina sp.]